MKFVSLKIVHSFTHSFNKHLLDTYLITELGAANVKISNI